MPCELRRTEGHLLTVAPALCPFGTRCGASIPRFGSSSSQPPSVKAMRMQPDSDNSLYQIESNLNINRFRIIGGRVTIYATGLIIDIPLLLSVFTRLMRRIAIQGGEVYLIHSRLGLSAAISLDHSRLRAITFFVPAVDTDRVRSALTTAGFTVRDHTVWLGAPSSARIRRKEASRQT